LPQHSLDTNGKLDGTAEGMKRLLEELVELAGQNDQSQSSPVLELQFGDVLTKTTLSVRRGVQCLSVRALLPRIEESHFMSRSSRLLASTPASESETELRWHAGEGRYVVDCNTPISELPRDASVLDTIIDTSEQARAWFSVVGACAPIVR
jgi:hypothetical protein